MREVWPPQKIQVPDNFCREEAPTPNDRQDFVIANFSPNFSCAVKSAQHSNGRKICKEISQLTRRGTQFRAPEQIVAQLNLRIRGWGNYFCLGSVSKAYRNVDAHARVRMRRWLCGKYKINNTGKGNFPDEYLYQKLGLIRLTQTTAHLPWAKT